MASAINVRSGEDYNKYFDPKEYSVKLFGEIEIPGFSFTEFRLKTLHEIFSTGKVKGRRLVDIGSGPCIHTVIPAARWFDEIFVTDYSKQNREFQEKWIRQDPDAHDWEKYFRYYSRLNGNENDWQTLERETRKKTNKVLFCDVHSENPLDPVKLDHVDAITSSACLESASGDKVSYNKAMKNVASLLAHGGYFILIAILGCTHYPVANERFQCLSLSREEVISAVKASGLTIIQEFDNDCKSDSDEAPISGSLIVLAQKK